MTDTRTTKKSSTRKKKVENQEMILPLITLRALIITPNSKLQITAARESSIAAFDFAKSQDDANIAVFCQLNEVDEKPDFKELHKTGVLCTLLNMKKKDSNTYQCLISGYTRIKLLEVIDEPDSSFRKARVLVLEEPKLSEKDINDTLNVLKSCLEYSIESSDKTSRALIEDSVPKHLVTAILEESSLSRLTDMLKG